MKIAQPLKYVAGNPVCPKCRAVIKPTLERGSIDMYIEHVESHDANATATLEELRGDLRRHTEWLAKVKSRIKEDALVLKHEERRVFEVKSMIELIKRLPIKTPAIRRFIIEARGTSPSMKQVRAFARRLGLIATPETNPILWTLRTKG